MTFEIHSQGENINLKKVPRVFPETYRLRLDKKRSPA